jgi:hypothetical protein
VLGGRQLLVGEREYTARTSRPSRVREVAEALGVIEEKWFRQCYATLAYTSYYGPVVEDDFDSTWSDLHATREFFANAAAAGRSTIFTPELCAISPAPHPRSAILVSSLPPAGAN